MAKKTSPPARSREGPRTGRSPGRRARRRPRKSPGQDPQTQQPLFPAAADLSVVSLEEEMKRSYLDYAMSVIIGRAIPDIKDGLKPVHRRVPLLHVRDGDDLQQALQEIGPHRRRRHRKIPSPRRPGGLRHDRPDGPGFQPALPPGRRPGQLRLDRRRPAGGHALHRSPDDQAGRGDAGRHREGHGQLRPELRREPDHARGPADQIPQPPGQRRARASPSAWPPTSRPTTWARSATGSSTCSSTPTRRLDKIMEFIPGPDFPTGGYIFNRQGIRDAYRDRPGHHPDPGQDPDRAGRQGRAGADRHHRDPLRRQQVPAHREHRRAGQRRRRSRASPTSATSPTGKASGSSSRSSGASCPRSS